ncbi:SsgA family sporulation/cell division regulator [Streptomyces sp. NPDC051987]|uniref:SsgA family sporulation/cell division regulator n=1 Tax=Streptomyces sp. NPDC051987 TaxID=3155808 RepID=UPI00343636C3
MTEHAHPSDHAHGNRPGTLELLTTLQFRPVPPDRDSIGCRFSYSVDDPFAVRMDLLVTAETCVTWVVGRDLLWGGTDRLSGEGDCKVWPGTGPHDRPLLHLRLEGPHGHATFATHLTVLRRWLDVTYAMVPSGSEGALLDWATLAESLLPPV